MIEERKRFKVHLSPGNGYLQDLRQCANRLHNEKEILRQDLPAGSRVIGKFLRHGGLVVEYALFVVSGDDAML